MNKTVWRNIGRFALLMLTQLLVLNYVYLGGYIMPMLPTNTGRIPMLLIAFGTGLIVDIMTGMLGFHALACTVVAMLRILFADRILTRGEPVNIATPSIYSVTPQYFIAYLMLLLGSFYFIFYATELWGFRGFGGVLLATLLSTIATALLAVLYQLLFVKKEES